MLWVAVGNPRPPAPSDNPDNIILKKVRQLVILEVSRMQ